VGVKIKGGAGLLANLSRTQERVDKASLAFLRDAGKFIAGQAKLRAPVDTYDLENAIVSEDNAHRDGFNRKTVDVYVDLERLDLDSRDGFDYAMEMHEGIYNLGPKSQKKDAMVDVGVGAKYLERAIEDNADQIREAAREVIHKALLR